jgi:hypothetical protein
LTQRLTVPGRAKDRTRHGVLRQGLMGLRCQRPEVLRWADDITIGRAPEHRPAPNGIVAGSTLTPSSSTTGRSSTVHNADFTAGSVAPSTVLSNLFAAGPTHPSSMIIKRMTRGRRWTRLEHTNDDNTQPSI